jgi:NAD(P)-dependent dehydrogenase (short-subunit alcohol dehydrogenase family)
MANLTGKIALITGGSGGIGLATARAFQAAGATVVTNGRHEARSAEIREQHGSVYDRVYTADIGNAAETTAFVDQVGKDYGRIDVLFANAGFGEVAPLGHITEDHFDRQFDVNVKGVLFTIQAALPYLPTGASVIINTSIVNQKGIAGFGVYAATKAAVRSLTKVLAAELVGKGVRVNAVSPGPIETAFFNKTGMTEEQIQQAAAQIQSQVPAGRFGKPDEIAGYVTFLASDASSFMLGTEVEIDGGMATL